MNRRAVGIACVNLAGIVAFSLPIALVTSSWHVVKSPDTGSNGPYVSRYLREVTAASASRVWAVGDSKAQSIIAAWTGSAWRLDALPHPSTYTLSAIDTNGSAVWATGLTNRSPELPVALRLKDGRWRYSVIRGGPPLASPLDLTVLSDSDVWVVGDATGTVAALALHWNGSSWSSQPPPIPAGASGVQLERVEQIRGTTKVIAVGYYVKSSKFYPYAVLWTGSRWRVMSPPANPEGTFDGVVVLSATSAWAVGYTNPNLVYSKSLIEHWNGIRWQRFSTPNRSDGNFLISIDARSSSDLWAVGYTTAPKGYGTLAMHWNGSRWSLVTTVDPYPGFDEFFGVSHVPGTGTFWAVGSQGPARPAALGESTLTERCTSC